MFTNVCDSTRLADTPVYNSTSFALWIKIRAKGKLVTRDWELRERENTWLQNARCALLFHFSSDSLELLIASFRWLKLKSYEPFQFPNCSRVVKSSFASMYIFAWFRAKFEDRNWNKCPRSWKCHEVSRTMFRGKLKFVLPDRNNSKVESSFVSL